MTYNASSHNVARIRELLLAAFVAEDLRRFCQDRPTFHQLVNCFGPSHGLDDMVDAVIDYCRTRSLWEELLSEVKKVRPRQYDSHGPYLLRPSPLVSALPLEEKPPKGCWGEIALHNRRVQVIMGIIVLALVISILVIKPRQEIASATQTATALALTTPSPSQTLAAMRSHTATPATPTDIPTTAAAHTPTLMVTATATLPSCMGRSPGNPEFFSVYPDYDPSGHMGDIGDIVNVEKGHEIVRFTYKVGGQGPHEWDWKYIEGELNPNSAKFAGVMYLYPPNNFGQEPGFDLRAFHHAIVWEARSLTGEVNVEFVIGGINWVWDEAEKIKVSPQCPDSLRRKSLGIHTLTEQWQSFEVGLSDIPEEEFVNVIGGFAWVISWGSADIQPDQPRTFEFEIRNIRYER